MQENNRRGLDKVLLIGGAVHQLPFADGVLSKVNSLAAADLATHPRRK